MDPESPADVAARLAAHRLPLRRRARDGRLPGAAMQRPLLLEGEPGTGKTALAEALAEALGPAADPAAVLRGHRRQPGALRLGLPAPDPAPARGRGRRRRRPTSRRPRRACTTSGSCSRGRCCGRCGRARRCCWSTRSTGPTTSSRRSCSRCCRPTRSRSPSSAPSGRDPADRGAHLQPHPRAARRAQAALPLPLDRPPRPRPRGRDRALPRARGLAGWRARSCRSCSSCATARPVKPPGSPRPSTGRGRWTTSAPPSSTWSPRRDARRAGEVPRGRRPGAGTPSTGCCGLMTDRDRPSAAADESCSASPGRCGRPGVPVTQDRAQAFLAAAAVARRSATSGRRTWPAGPRCARGPDDLDALRPGLRRRASTPATGCPARGPRQPARPRLAAAATTERRRRGRRPTTTCRSARRWPARPRCCGTATSRR